MSVQGKIAESGQIAEQMAPGLSDASHTPTPWNLGYTGRCILREIPGMCDGEDGYAVAITSAHSLLTPAEAKANAAFIVRAVNSHDALVKALEEMIEVYWGHGDGEFPEPNCIQAALAALASSREVQP